MAAPVFHQAAEVPAPTPQVVEAMDQAALALIQSLGRGVRGPAPDPIAQAALEVLQEAREKRMEVTRFLHGLLSQAPEPTTVILSPVGLNHQAEPTLQLPDINISKGL